MKKIIILVSTGFYSGYCPIASGTAGSVAGIFVYLLISRLTVAAYLITTVSLFFFGVWTSTEAEKIFHNKDSSKIVIDEIVGMLITMIMLPVRWKFIITGFLLFRFFDIWKPFSAVEDIRDGWGVMTDDAIAGIISNIIIQIGIVLI